MKCILVSDLHLEFCDIELPGDPTATLLLSGDIVPVDFMRDNRTDKYARRMQPVVRKFFDHVSANYKQVFYIFGNHEHYHGRLEANHEIAETFLVYPNVKILDKTGINITANTRLFGGTLWTDFANGNPMYMQIAEGGMNDFAGLITHNYEIHGKNSDYNSSWHPPFRAQESVDIHRATLKALAADIEQNPDKDYLVMTHHTPSYKSINHKYIGNDLNYAYSSDLSNFMFKYPQIKNWTHGHTHDTCNYTIGECHVMCNPRGYARSTLTPPENANFNPTFNFEVRE